MSALFVIVESHNRHTPADVAWWLYAGPIPVDIVISDGYYVWAHRENTSGVGYLPVWKAAPGRVRARFLLVCLTPGNQVANGARSAVALDIWLATFVITIASPDARSSQLIARWYHNKFASSCQLKVPDPIMEK